MVDGIRHGRLGEENEVYLVASVFGLYVFQCGSGCWNAIFSNLFPERYLRHQLYELGQMCAICPFDEAFFVGLIVGRVGYGLIAGEVDGRSVHAYFIMLPGLASSVGVYEKRELVIVFALLA